MNIEGIPDSISRSAYLAMLEPLGIELRDVRSLTFGTKHITAEVMARDAEGRFTVDQQTNEIVVHHIAIPIIDEP